MSEKDRSSGEESEKDDTGKINALQIAAATGAATTAAVVANALNIYGTVVGVAVFSVISSVGTVVYLKSMNHTKKKLDKVVKNRETVVLRTRTGGGETTVATRPAAPEDPAATAPPTKAAGTAKVPTVVTPDAAEPSSAAARAKDFLKRNWRSIAVSSLVVFVLTVGLLTSIAMLSGQPATSYYDSRPNQTPTTQQEQTGDEEQQSGDDEPTGEQSPSDDESTAPESEQPSSPAETEPEPEPSTQDSEPEDGGGGDGDLKPTPSGDGIEAS